MYVRLTPQRWLTLAVAGGGDGVMAALAVAVCRVYQELDFPWTLDAALVLQLIPQVVDIVTQEVARVYADQVPAGVQLKVCMCV